MSECVLIACVACGSNMKEGYSICPECNSYQNKKKRNIKKIINAFSGLSIILGALTIIISFYPQVKNTLYYNEDIDLVSINSTMSGTPGNMSFINKGDGDVFVSELVMSLSNHDIPFEIRIPIHKLIKKNEMETIRFDSKLARSGVYSDTVGEKEFAEWLKNKKPEEVAKNIYKCFLLKPFDKLKGGYLINKKLLGVKVQPTIHYFSLETKKMDTFKSQTPIQGLLFRRPIKGCGT